jgi:hypothetical protein
MSDSPDKLTNRLDALGAAMADGAPTLDENSDFLGAVQRRARAVHRRNTFIAAAGVSLAAAALVVAAFLNPPRVPVPGPRATFIDPVVAANLQDLPTIGQLNRTAWSSKGLGELPAFDEGGGPIEEPLHAGAARSQKVVEDLLGL